MEKAVKFFCEMQPNYDDLHQPNDLHRFLKIIYLSVKNSEDIPYKYINELLSSKTRQCMNSGTIDSFISSCQEFEKNARYALMWAENNKLLK